MKTPHFRLLAIATVAASFLSACGGGDTSSPTAPAAATPTVSGTAATGAAIAGGSVSMNCVSGSSASATTAADGSYTLNVTGIAFPCVARVSYGTEKLHSYVSAAGVTNITPVTELLVAYLTGGSALDAFDKFDATKAKALTVTQITAAIAVVKAYLVALGVSVADFPADPLGVKFVAKAGTTDGDKFDKVLDDLQARLKVAGKKLGDAVADINKGSSTATTNTGTNTTGTTATGNSGVVVGTQKGGSRQGVALNIGAGAGVVTTFAGSGPSGSTKGTGAAALFTQPSGITTDGTNLYIADFGSEKIRKIVIATGEVMTIAGSGAFSSTDGTGIAAAFSAPAGITTDGTNLYVVDQASGRIRQIVISTGVVTSLASVPGSPYGITTDGVNLYVTELTGNKVDMIVISTGQVTTLAGSGAFTNTGTDGTGILANLVRPAGLTTDGVNLYVAEVGNGKIRKIVIATGVVTTLAGQVLSGTTDGTGTAATFKTPYDITSDGTNLYVADATGIRKIVIATGEVTTLAGSGTVGAADGTGTSATFGSARGIVTDGVSLYVTDTTYNNVRKIR